MEEINIIKLNTILINPLQNDVQLKDKCQNESYQVKEPTIITLNNCSVEISGIEFEQI